MTPRDQQLVLRIGHDEIVIRRRYEAVSILNDVLIALWFITGSVMFFSASWTRTGTWRFLLGSVELLLRPAIRLARQVHLRRLRDGVPATAAPPHDDAQDY
ncbi:YrhK family protein [Streptomyces sp. NPDC087300]|uniref:YrhK family protein n=1 Tax=Streptomyces sp. NPDC087300 TaxID=3365780 RepID=UPI003801D754